MMLGLDCLSPTDLYLNNELGGFVPPSSLPGQQRGSLRPVLGLLLITNHCLFSEGVVNIFTMQCSQAGFQRVLV